MVLDSAEAVQEFLKTQVWGCTSLAWCTESTL
jgi:hypothetical protein